MSGVERMRLDIRQERRVLHSSSKLTVIPVEPRLTVDEQAANRWPKQGKQCTPQQFKELQAWAVAFAKDRAARGIPPRGPSILDGITDD